MSSVATNLGDIWSYYQRHRSLELCMLWVCEINLVFI